jgi:signal transduction histidine kinase
LLVVALGLGLTIAASVAAPPAGAEPAPTDRNLLLDTIRANRRALVAVNLNLSAEEAAKFWPLYERYEQEMNTLGDRLAAVVEDYASNFRDLGNDKALQLVRDYQAVEADRLQVRRTYLDEFAKILPGRTVARFFQIENKMDAVIRYDLAATIPVVDEASPPPAK